MHRLVPEFITDQYQTGERSGTFPAVGLFVDLSGFTEMTNSLMKLGQHGAEILAAIMRQVFDPMINSIYQHGGFVSTFSGDAFTSLFPISSAKGTASLNAVTSAIEMQQFIADLPAQSTLAGDFHLSVRIGLASGEVDWGIIASSDHQRAAYYFRGSTVEGCIASENKSRKGEIILDAETRHSLDPQIKLEPLDGHFQLLEAPAILAEKTPIPELVDNLTASQLFYPEEVLTQTQSGEFRQIVNLFISLPTVRTREQLEIFMQSLFDLQQRYGGFLNRLDFGDKGAHLLLFWGAPVTHENDIGRALNFILELQAETAIPIKAGATYRIAHAGFIGNHLREEFTCYGEGVNLAARFMTEASRGEIWICDRIARRVQDHFVLDPLGEQVFKGFEKPEPVYALIEREETVSRLFTSPFIGREPELSTLLEAATPLWQGVLSDPIILLGQPGIGKSRLVHKFKDQITASGHEAIWVRCQSDQVLRNSFNPIRYWLKNYFKVNESQADARNKRNFNRKLDNLISQTSNDRIAAALDRTRSFIGNLINLDWADSLYQQVDPQSRYENTIAGLIALLQAESQNSPLILLLEDIQWIDNETLDLLTQLYKTFELADNTGFPILILVTAREIPPVFRNQGTLPFKEILLNSLSPHDIETLASEILGSKLDLEFTRWIHWVSEGNPYFLEQILYFLLDRGSISPTDKGWALAVASPDFLPTDLRAILISRLDQVSPEVKLALQTASILGREFNLPLLREMLDDDPALQSNLDAAQQAFLITQVSDHQYIFQSNLLRETTYQMQAVAQRRKLHATAVKALEALFKEDRSASYPELAFHAEQAGLIQTAIDYLEKAGITARENYANRQAIEFLSRAILLMDDVKNEQFLNLLLLREGLYSLLGKRQEQIDDLRLADRAAKTLSSPKLMAAVSNRLAFYNSQVGDYLNAIRFSQEAIAKAQQAGDVEIEIDARNHWAIASRHQGEYQHAQAQSTYGLELALKTENPNGICLSLNSLSLTAIEQGQFDQAAAYLEESLVTAREAGNVNVQAQTLNNLGNIYGELGDFSSAFQAYSQALEISQTIGNRMGEGLVSTNLGWIAGLLGNYIEAESYLELSVQIAKEIGDVYNQAFSLVNLCLFETSQQKFKAARKHGEIALEILRQVGHKPGEAVAHTYLGHVFLGQKGYEMARNCYRDALRIREDLGQHGLSMEALAGIAEITLQTSSAAEALQVAEPILSFLDQGGALDGIDQPFRVYTTCIRILQANQHPDASSFISNAYQVLQKQADQIKDKNARSSFLEFVPCHREMLRMFEEENKNPGPG